MCSVTFLLTLCGGEGKSLGADTTCAGARGRERPAVATSLNNLTGRRHNGACVTTARLSGCPRAPAHVVSAPRLCWTPSRPPLDSLSSPRITFACCVGWPFAAKQKRAVHYDVGRTLFQTGLTRVQTGLTRFQTGLTRFRVRGLSSYIDAHYGSINPLKRFRKGLWGVECTLAVTVGFYRRTRKISATNGKWSICGQVIDEVVEGTLEEGKSTEIEDELTL
eukprot:56152-Prorocentrum_minimum.AAC.1